MSSPVRELALRELAYPRNTLYADCLKIIQAVTERVYTVPGTQWNTRFPDCVRNILVVNGRRYTVPGTHGNALRHCLQLVPGMFTVAHINILE